MIDRIICLMESANINARKLTTDLELSGSTITEWKKGRAKPSTDAIIKIANYFQVTTDWLLTGEGERTVSSAITQQHQSSDSEAMLFELLDTYRAADKEKRRAILQAALNTTADKTAMGRTKGGSE